MPAPVTKPELIHHIALRATRRSVDISDAIEELLRRRGWNARDASAEARRLQIPVEQAIDEHLRTFAGRQLVTYFQRDPKHPHRVRPIPAARRFVWTAAVQKALMGLKPRKFEVLLGNLFVGTEFSDVAVTPETADGGIDFVGKVRLRGRPIHFGAVTGPSPLEGQSVYFFGQAKRYSMAHPVETAEIDTLVGAAKGLEHGGGTPAKDRMVAALTSWGWQVNSPLVPLFATTGWFRSTIPGYARTQRFSIFDGEQLAQRVLITAGSATKWESAEAMIRRLCDLPLSNVKRL